MNHLSLGRDFSVFDSDVPTLQYSDPALKGDGSVSINPAKHLVKWGWVAATYQGQTPIALPGKAYTSTAEASIVADMTIDSQQGAAGDFEVSTLMATSSGRFMVRPRVNTGVIDRYLANQATCDRLIMGTSQLPGGIFRPVYNLPKSSWKFELGDLANAGTNNVAIVAHGRRFLDRQRIDLRRRRAESVKFMHPYWIGPFNPSNPSLSGAEVTLSANTSIVLTFPIPDDADFLCRWILDDSTSASGVEPVLYGDLKENLSGRGLMDLPPTFASGSTNLGLQWRDFVACPSVSVTGMTSLGLVKSFSTGAPRGKFTHLFPRNTQIVVRFTSLDASTITLRPCFFGYLVYQKEPASRRLSAGKGGPA